MIKEPISKDGFHVGQEGTFTVYDSYHRPIESVDGKIIRLMEGQASALYAMLKTKSGIRPARLS